MAGTRAAATVVIAPDLRSIRTFPQLIRYLQDVLEWPVESEDLDEAAFEYEPEELALDPKYCARIKSIKQIRPLRIDQPWGVFWIEFEAKRLPVVVLRQILARLVVKRRESSNPADRATWRANDLLFISAHGESGGRGLTFAHFRDRGDGKPHLRSVSTDERENPFFLEFNQRIHLEKLRWPEDPSDRAAWEEQWGSAFRVGHGEAIRTSRELAERLALLAQRTRKLIADLFEAESDAGPLHKLFASFQASLIHDMAPERFADMYAQTLAYGIFSAMVSGEKVFGQVDLEAIVPATNPFLKRLFREFVRLGERRRQRIDFDGLGVGEIVELLGSANLGAILEDFGRQSGGGAEDPVVHFYEDFLQIYDRKQKKGRGVYYTPKPVVSYIVRSVDEVLKKDFGLEDGLADTATWGEMAARLPGLELPEHARPEDPFVRILDPATGTGTFLDTVIETIFETLRRKWSAARMSEEAQAAAWNEYVPRHLLPRLYGFELMMAPYAVCHMKLAYTLKKTGYDFKSDERIRVYLTNALEPPREYSIPFDFLAEEAKSSNVVKSRVPITVVVGNPPYSGHSANKGEWIDGLLHQRLPDGTPSYFEVDGQPLGERNPKWLNDDYVKFFRFGQMTISKSPVGVFSMITNHGYLDNPTFRGMRQSLMNTFPAIAILNLHGNAKKKEKSPDGKPDENVFDIQQGVSIACLVKSSSSQGITVTELWGLRESKYRCLLEGDIIGRVIAPRTPFYFFCARDEILDEEYSSGVGIPSLAPVNSVGIVTARDALTIHMTKQECWKVAQDFAAIRPETARTRYFLGNDVRDWQVALAQADVRMSGPSRDKLARILYRPFDNRFTYYTGVTRGFHCMPRPEVMRHMLAGENVGLVSARSNKSAEMNHFYCAQSIMETKCGESTTQSCLFPLYLYPTDSPSTLFELEEKTDAPGGRRPNLDPRFTSFVAEKTGLAWIPDGAGDLAATFGPEDLFHAIYAQFHSPTYRARYAEFLKSDFPRVFTPKNRDLFAALARLGADLVALHLLEPEYRHASWMKAGRNPFKGPIAKYRGAEKPEVAKGFPQFEDGAVRINEADRFEGVPENVWNFQVGGYQVLSKWLKDRRGRKLSTDDIAHYGKIVVALNETIRLMAEVDAVIKTHGGWPDAFVKEKPVLESRPAVPVAPPSAVSDEESVPWPKKEPAKAKRHPVKEPDDAPGSIDEISRDEVMARIRDLLADGEERDRETVIHDLARASGFKRTGPRIREALNGDLIAAARRGIIVTESGLVKLLCRNIEQYERDFLKEQLLASLGAGWHERDDALRTLTQWLGFRRAGERIQETFASIVNGLIRADRLETEGSRIRRKS